jgi:DNA polymerase I-like protein with 3'-5' exonuclease and polymerase domains
MGNIQTISVFDLGGNLDWHKPWMDTKTAVLVNESNIAECMDACINAGRYALDLETTGLDNRVKNGLTVDQIVGVCLSGDGITGYYIPLGHMIYHPDGSVSPHRLNVKWDIFDAEFRRLIDATMDGRTIAVFHNGKFDQEFLQFNRTGTAYGEWDKPSTWDDTLILAYLNNSRERRRGLKHLSETLLGIEQLELDDLKPESGPSKKKDPNWKKDFSRLDPSLPEVLWYGVGDALCTRLLYDAIAPQVLVPNRFGHDQRLIYQIEKSCVASTRWMERNRIKVDPAKLEELILLGQQEWVDALREAYESANKVLGRDVMPMKYKILLSHFENSLTNKLDDQLDLAEMQAKKITETIGMIGDGNGKEWPALYDINASGQLGTMFQEMKVPNLKFTEKTGQVNTAKAEIDRIIDETGDDFIFMPKIKRFRETWRALGNYLYPLYQDRDPEDDTIRIQFNGHKVDTGRYSTPSKDNVDGTDTKRKEVTPGHPQVNFQAIPGTYDDKKTMAMNRLRECIISKSKDRIIAAVDYSGVELRIVTSLSREPLWIEEFYHCSSCDRKFDKLIDEEGFPVAPPPRCPNCGSDKIGDLHTLTAISVYGKEAQNQSDWKNLRKKSKSANFALVYGGGGKAVQRAVGVDINEGWRIKNIFGQTYKGLQHWWDVIKSEAKQQEYIRTALGRKYPLPDINSADKMMQSKAERNATNGPIQGASADITKTAMSLIYKEFKDRGWLDKCQMIITMHDELVFDIEKGIAQEALKVIYPLMTRNSAIKSLHWPIALTCDVEMGYDWSVPWDLNAITYDEVRFVEDKAYDEKKAKKAGYEWETLTQRLPNALQGYFVFDNIETPVSPLSIAPPTPKVSTAMSVDTFEPGDVYTYQLKSTLTPATIQKLSKVIYKTYNQGTQRLRILTNDGVELTGWESPLLGEGQTDIRVNASWFATLAQVESL